MADIEIDEIIHLSDGIVKVYFTDLHALAFYFRPESHPIGGIDAVELYFGPEVVVNYIAQDLGRKRTVSRSGAFGPLDLYWYWTILLEQFIPTEKLTAENLVDEGITSLCDGTITIV